MLMIMKIIFQLQDINDIQIIDSIFPSLIMIILWSRSMVSKHQFQCLMLTVLTTAWASYINKNCIIDNTHKKKKSPQHAYSTMDIFAICLLFPFVSIALANQGDTCNACSCQFKNVEILSQLIDTKLAATQTEPGELMFNVLMCKRESLIYEYQTSFWSDLHQVGKEFLSKFHRSSAGLLWKSWWNPVQLSGRISWNNLHTRQPWLHSWDSWVHSAMVQYSSRCRIWILCWSISKSFSV